jgi:CDP-diacylglycerol--glycerol-3-phosphate 3-phosphatidyltransferase
VRLYEYLRPSWTFHAKGLWLYTSPSADSAGPALTLIGSPNFGYRSVHRDLELQLALVTTNHRLRQQLHQEQAAVFAHSTAVTAEVFAAPDRYVPYWVRLIIRTMKHFF